MRLGNSKEIQLRPNCLLTLYPIVLFTHKKPEVAKYLIAHGYDVVSFDANFFNLNSTRKSLKHFFDLMVKTKTPFHFICDSQIAKQVDTKALSLSPICKSIEFTTNKGLVDEYLNLVIRLAEQDMT